MGSAHCWLHACGPRHIVRMARRCIVSIGFILLASYHLRSRVSLRNPNSNNSQPTMLWRWSDGKDASNVTAVISEVYRSTCGNYLHGGTASSRAGDMTYLCAGHFVQTSARLLLDGRHVNVVQIGAHVGFEGNDPLAEGLSSFLRNLATATGTDELRRNFHWTFVEPSPPNFRGLQKNIESHRHMCDMRSLNAAVVSDLDNNPGRMVFYAIVDTVNPFTGYDSKSGKSIPEWLTQISSLSREQMYQPAFEKAFAKFGLDIKDYVQEINVTTIAYSDLMANVLQGVHGEPNLVLIDTEGFDCQVVKGLSPHSKYLPKYLIFEYIHCDFQSAIDHLVDMGYLAQKPNELGNFHSDDVVAMHPDLSEYWPTSLVLD